MKIFKQQLTPEAIHRIIKGEAVLNNEAALNNIADPKTAGPQSIIFVDNEKFLALALESGAGLKLVSNRFRDDFRDNASNLIFTENAYHSVLILMHFWLETEKGDFISAIHPTAVIGKGVSLPEKVNIGAYCVIGDNVRLGEYTTIGAFSSVGNDSSVGQHCCLYPNVTVYSDTIIGDNVTIHSGCVIGSDGFGYLPLNGIQQKIPQIGHVVIQNHVEIGANSTIDRGTIGPTVIGEGTKIDNLVQIGHNCVIGKHCIICAQVGMAGSSNLGDYVYLAGQVGLAGHLTIGDGAKVGAQSGVANDLPSGKQYLGYPARDAMLMKKIMAALGSLPEIYKFYSKLKKERERE
jgi:UDP-3-O-[3-hydroxymyristoyl] glucosamine N-acyltransferase